MNYNLLEETWIPVFREDGSRDWIAPHQIAEKDNPPIAFAGRLPDFNSAYTQFMVGLLQTSFAPEDADEHEEFYTDRPSPEELKKAFLVHQEAFYLVHENEDHPLFFQTPLHTLPEKKQEKYLIGVDWLIHESGSKDKSTDHNPLLNFTELNLREVAVALLSMQIDGSGDSAGFYPSLRGGGSITASIKCEGSLWKTLWLNVLPSPHMNTIHAGSPNSENNKKIFSWMHEDLMKSWEDKKDHVITPKDANPNFVFWSISKNIRLIVDEDFKVRQVMKKKTKRLVPKDGEGWRHPMTPYLPSSSDKPIRAQKAIVNFDVRDWIIARYAIDKDNKLECLPKTFEFYLSNSDLQDTIEKEKDIIRIHLTGPDYKNNQGDILGYLDRTFPLLSTTPFEEKKMKNMAGKLVNIYTEMTNATRNKCWKAQRNTNHFKEFERQIGIWYEHEPAIISNLYRWKDTPGIQEDNELLRDLLKSFKKRFLEEYTQITGLREDASRSRIKVEGTEMCLAVEREHLSRQLAEIINNGISPKKDNENEQ